MRLKPKNIREMSPIEREQKIKDLREELFKLHSSSAMGGTLKSPTRIREIRRTIARILTVMNEEHEI